VLGCRWASMHTLRLPRKPGVGDAFAPAERNEYQVARLMIYPGKSRTDRSMLRNFVCVIPVLLGGPNAGLLVYLHMIGGQARLRVTGGSRWLANV